MPENNPALPEGTDQVIEGASTNSPAIGTERVTTDTSDELIEVNAAPNRGAAVIEKLRSGGEKLTEQAGEKARGLVSQGLERSAEALANVSKLIGDTAPGLEERLGPEYAGYARRAAAAIENTANTIAEKDPDELIDDTRNFVRNSPGLALAGAAIAGFVLARLVKTGLTRDEDEED
jgi:hypothetical protein